MDIDDLVTDYGDGPELTYDFASTLYMIKRGKHYSDVEASKILYRLSKDAQELSSKLSTLALMYSEG